MACNIYLYGASHAMGLWHSWIEALYYSEVSTSWVIMSVKEGYHDIRDKGCIDPSATYGEHRFHVNRAAEDEMARPRHSMLFCGPNLFSSISLCRSLYMRNSLASFIQVLGR